MIEDLILTEEDLKARINPLAFFIHYIVELTGEEPEDLSKFPAPYRDDEHSSFGLFEHYNGELLFKDAAYNKSGDIIEFVKLIYNLNTRKEAFNLLVKHLRENKVEKLQIKEHHKVVKKQPTTIEIVSKPFTPEAFDYWKQYHINKRILKKYNCSFVDMIKMDKRGKVRLFQPPFAFAYRIVDSYQIYQPYNKEFKFFNSLSDKYILGFHQLPPTGDLLIIDKSMKDIMFCDYLKLPAVAPRAEGIMIPDEYLKHLKTRFKRIVVMLDNDEPGIVNANKYPKEYEKVFLKSAKDKTDLVLSVGLKKAKKEIFSLLNI